MKQMSQSLTQDGLLNSGFGFVRMVADAAKAARKPQGHEKSTSPINFVLEMQRSNRLETPIWILLAASACVALALSL